MESMIQNARTLARQTIWQYRYEAQCEMGIAIAYHVIGEQDKAIETLEVASKLGSPIFLNRELDLWFIFDRLRGKKSFDALLER